MIFISTESISNLYQSEMHKRIQNQLIQEQDEHLQQIHHIATHLKDQGREFGVELEKQRGYMNQLDRQMDLTNTKLNAVQRRLGELLETDDAGQMCTCMIMYGICFILVLLIVLI